MVNITIFVVLYFRIIIKIVFDVRKIDKKIENS
jgi:hypothetical protein